MDDGPDDDAGFRPPPPPDDRIWRHPSELSHHDTWDDGDPIAHPGGMRLVRQPADVSSGPLLRVAMIAALGGALLTWGIVAVTGGIGRDVVQVVEKEAVPLATPASLTAANDVVEIAAKVRPAITRIEVSGMGGSGTGSGVLFRDNGYLLTNSHVVAGASQIVVIASDGREHDGTLVGHDPDTDIAVVKIEGDGFPTAVLGSATDLEVGEAAVAIGSPLGLRGGPSVTLGVISALGRTVEASKGPPLLDMIQTDAPISPGSSGGALLDARGAVIGITTAVAVTEVGAEGLGFATPIDVARAVADDLITSGKVTRVWLGIEGLDLAATEAEELGILGGALVERVIDDSPAARAGLDDGDVIVALDGDEVGSMSELVVLLRARDVGEAVELEVLRDGDRTTVTATLEERA